AGSRIDWVSVEKDMRPSTWSATKLQQRIKTLKRRYDNNVLSFPPRYFRSPPDRAGLHLEAKAASPLRFSPSPHTISILSPQETYNATEGLFCLLTRRDVRASERQLNTGEITMAGVSMLIEEANIQVNDVFLDAGSGVGNVLAQIALQTQAFRVVGIEIQRDLAARDMELIALEVGSTQLPYQLRHPIIFHDTVFEEDVVLAMRALCMKLPHLRLVALTTRVCPRHRNTCRNSFCKRWKLLKTIQVPMTYSSSPRDLHLYAAEPRWSMQ
ncbi:hypothetical protein PHYSODRAFT_534973, partial [Phytophthora sojae]